MKRLFLTILVIFTAIPTALATPDYDRSQDTANVVFVGVEEAKYNNKLLEQLKKDFREKYTDENGIFYAPLNAYAVEVGSAFLEQRKMYNH